MLNIAKLGTGTAHNYFAQEFAAASSSYLSEDGKSVGIWQGKLARQLGLHGPVEEESYHRLIDGKHPVNGEQLIQHRHSHRTDAGKEVAHIPAWDFNLSVPKTWSLAAIVGGDNRLTRAAETANRNALETAENYVQSRGGGSNPPITARQWLVATFRHDTSRPVDGYPSPQLHFHNVVLNLVRERETNPDGKWRSLQTAELYRISSLITQTFRDELLREGRALGYEMAVDPATGAPEIQGFSQEYLDAESLRSAHIRSELEKRGFSGPRAAQIVARQDREEKLDLTPDELRSLHQAHAAAFGNQAQQSVERAISRGEITAPRISTAQEAVAHARKTLSERSSVFEHHQVVRNALRYGNGTVTTAEIEKEIERRIESSDLSIAPHGRRHTPEPAYRTPEAIAAERFIIERALSGSNSVEPICPDADLTSFPELKDNPVRQGILRDILASKDQFLGLNGTAGSAKSTAANILRQFAESNGFAVRGLAPTGTARDALEEKGIQSDTLQHYLALSRKASEEAHRKTFYIVDETSLASTTQMRRFLGTVKPEDHVLFVGDDSPDPKKTGQYTSVEAGRVFQLLQESGMTTAEFNRVYRQKDPELKAAVREFRHGNLERGFSLLSDQNRLHEFGSKHERYRAIAERFCIEPTGSIVVVPDNKARCELNEALRLRMRISEHLRGEDQLIRLLISRDTTSAEHTLAISYRPADSILFHKQEKALGVNGKSYATVLKVDTERNQLTVRTENGRILSYDPKNAPNVSIYETRIQPFSAGDRIQFTSKSSKKLGVSTRDLGTVRSLDAAGNMAVTLDNSGRQVRFNVRQNPHIDYGYCFTGHSVQGKTVKRALWNVEADDPRLSRLLSATAAYVGVSRPEYDLQVFTDHIAQLVPALSRSHEAAKALAPEEIRAYSNEAELRTSTGVSVGNQISAA